MAFERKEQFASAFVQSLVSSGRLAQDLIKGSGGLAAGRTEEDLIVRLPGFPPIPAQSSSELMRVAVSCTQPRGDLVRMLAEPFLHRIDRHAPVRSVHSHVESFHARTFRLTPALTRECPTEPKTREGDRRVERHVRQNLVSECTR